MNEIQAAIKNAVDSLLVTDHLAYKDYLQAIYVLVKKQLRSYSYLQFAADLGFPRSNVIHLMICGRRKLTSKAAVRIVDSLQLSGIQKNYFETLIRYENSINPDERKDFFQALLLMKNQTVKSALAQSQMTFFHEWYHPVIYEMMRFPDFSSDPYSIAERIKPRIRPEQARKSLDLLEKLGLAVFDGVARRHVPTSNQVTTGDEIASIAIVRYHQRMIDLGKEAITSFGEAERDISAIAIAVSSDTGARIKSEIQAFRKRILTLADEARDTQRVYQMNIQFFPVSTKD